MTDRQLGWFLAACSFCFFAFPAFYLGESELLSVLTDDAFYYFQIARQVVEGNGFTFDGLHRTNGFQPGWQLLLLPIFALSSDPIRVALLLQAFLVGAAIFLLWSGLVLRVGRRSAFLTVLLILCLPDSRAVLGHGMESGLLLFALVLCWRVWLWLQGQSNPSALHYVLLGAACTLATMARLEGGATFLVALWLLRQHRPLRRTVLPLGLPLMLIGSAYLVWNLLYFDSILPISGRVKMSVWAFEDLSERVLGLLDIPLPGKRLVTRLFGAPQFALGWSAALRVLAVSGLASLAFVIWHFRKQLASCIRQRELGYLLGVCALMVLADHLMLGASAQIFSWYAVPLYLGTALILPMIANGRWPYRMVVAACLFLSFKGIQTQQRSVKEWALHYNGQAYEMARWLSQELPKDAVLGSFNSGILGYYAAQRVINLDGLVNDRDYFDRVLRGGQLEAYLLEQGITYIVDPSCDGDGYLGAMLGRIGASSVLARLVLIEDAGRQRVGVRCPIQLRQISPNDAT